MTEEITYANLKFQEPYPLENITEPEYTEKEAHPNLSSKWRVAAVTSITLCLLLLVGLAALAVLFFQATKDNQREAAELKQREEVLQTNLSKKLQEIKESLCLEGEKEDKNNGVSCTLCPANWQWKGGKFCYYVSTGQATWGESQKSCSMWNSTLVLVKDKAKEEFLKKTLPKLNYWIGLSFKEGRNGWFWEDNTPLIQPQLTNYYLCAYFDSWYNIYTINCATKLNWICEKAAFQLNLTHSHHNEV